MSSPASKPVRAIVVAVAGAGAEADPSVIEAHTLGALVVGEARLTLVARRREEGGIHAGAAGTGICKTHLVC